MGNDDFYLENEHDVLSMWKTPCNSLMMLIMDKDSGKQKSLFIFDIEMVRELIEELSVHVKNMEEKDATRENLL